MNLASRILRAALAVAALCGPATWAADAPDPLECPQCGEWTLILSAPPGAVGERLRVDQDRMSIPMCGEFHPRVESSSIEKEEGGGYRYHLSIALQGAGGGSCAAHGLDALVAEVDISVAYHRDGGAGDFVIVHRATGKKVFAASGWNFERDNPCDSGSGRGSLACMLVANAQLQRQLSQSAVLANPRYRVGLVFTAAERACRHKGQHAGGSWPSAWRESCKAELLQEKLDAFTAFHECSGTRGRSCRVPDERVGKPRENTP